jgi:ELWxxDGT repeat protein
MTAFRVVFMGDDASGNRNLWVTDGTAAGTSELTIAGVGSLGLFPVDLTVLGSQVVFDGEDDHQNHQLWVTDGTSAGTSELTVAGAYPLAGGLSPADFTILGSKALFAGRDAQNHLNLWVTDGTAVGTSELAVSGANSSGIFAPSGSRGGGAVPPDFTVLAARRCSREQTRAVWSTFG